MLDQIKKKRLSLTHEFNFDRPRISSKQKRKQIEANLQQFKKDVNESRPTSPFQSANNFYSHSQISILNQSPTMKDLISPLEKGQKIQKSQKQSPRFREQQQKLQQKQIHEHEEKQKQQWHRNQRQNLNDKQNSKANDQIPLNNESNNGSSLIRQINNPDFQKLQRQMSFGQSQLEGKTNQQNKSGRYNNSKMFEPSYQKKQDDANKLNFNYNDSNYGGGSSNGSSAILFTSQFRDYINKDKNHEEVQVNQQIEPITQSGHKKKSQASQNRTVTDKQIGDSFLKIGEEQLFSDSESRKKLVHNQSGRSLAFSNNEESMLRQSKTNQLIAQQIVNKKLDEQLVLEIDHFAKNKFKDFSNRVLENNITSQFKGILAFLMLHKNIEQFKKKQQNNLKRYCFDAFLILKQYKFEQVKNQIKAENFEKEINQKELKRCFYSWKAIAIQKQKKVFQNNMRNQQKLLKNIFQVFKMIRFDSKINRQVDLYRLSKIFNTLRVAVANQRKVNQTIALKQYCKSLKKQYFNKMQEGIQQIRKQRLNNELAIQHHRSVTLKQFFDAWVQLCGRSPQYVSLTMTSKNVFKQTLDHKWLGIKTVDFKQTKQQ